MAIQKLHLSGAGQKVIRFSFFICLLVTGALEVNAQQLDNITKQQPLTLNGFVSTNQVLSSQIRDTAQHTSYTGYYTGSLNFNLYGISVPLSFIYSNQKGNFSHPFNQYSMHPSYKWVRAHIGYASMSFSPYTLNGHLFLGAGAEIDPPGLVRASVMYGRLKKAIPGDTSNAQQTPAYKRMGYGIKIGLARESDYIDFVVFGASDKYSLEDTIPSSYNILPQENTAFSVSLGKLVAKKLRFKAEYANSFITSDARTAYSSERKLFLEPASWFMPGRMSSVSRDALKANMTYQQVRWSLGLGYERVDPDYATLGAYYFTNNLENITLNFSVNFFENKLSLTGNGGLQKDNLDGSKLNNNKRYVGSGNLSITPGEKLNLALSYSNFMSYTNVRSTFDYINETSPYENWDTLNYRQISQNININSSYQLSGNKKNRQSLTANLTYQGSDDQQADSLGGNSRFYNANAAYVLALLPSDLNITTSLNYNRNEAYLATSTTIGPALSLSKLFLKKALRSSFTGSYNTSSTNSTNTGSIWNFRLGASYVIKKKHNLNTNLLYQLRNSNARQNKTFTLTFSYTYNFSILDRKNTQTQPQTR